MPIVDDTYSAPAGTTAIRLGVVVPDVTAPVWPGGAVLTASAVTSTSYTVTASAAATDAVGVVGYEHSMDGGATWTPNSPALSLAVSKTGRTPGSTDAFRMRAFDAAGNRSAQLSLAVTLFGAGGLPAWAPSSVGTAVLLSMTNTLQAVWATGTFADGKGTQVLADYSGGVWNPFAGPIGIFSVHGGGHAAFNDNGVYSANLNLLAWQADFPATDLAASGKWVNYAGTANETGVLANSYDYFTVYGSGSTGWATPADTGGRQFPSGGTVSTAGTCETLPGVPGSAHTYQTMCIQPPSMGGGSLGSLLRVTSSAVAMRASRSTGWVHRYDYAAGTWSRVGSNACAWASPGATAVLDTLRRKVVLLNPPQFTVSTASEFSLDTLAWSNPAASVPNPGGYVDNSLGCYHEARDIIVQATCVNPASAGTPALFYWHAGSSTIATRAAVTWTGAAPTHFNFGQGSLVYLPNGQLFYYTRFEPDLYYLIDVPANPANPWTATAFSISGALPSAFSPAPAGSIYGRMAYVDAAKCVVWLTGNTGSQTHFGGRVWALRIIP